MYQILKTDGCNEDFKELCELLDENLDELVGRKFQRSQYAQYNTLENIHNVIIFYDGDKAIAAGSFKEYDDNTAELKRVFVRKEYRGKGLSKKLVKSIEQWANEEGYEKMILETGAPLVAAMGLYKRIGYQIIPNYGQYVTMKDSICMEKCLG
ncbi:predicted acetyltransferase [Lachnospiraceae bacterium KM106-2]|nr:predicted acetyltransferase [Lachnospiraceae bacterium KM106-2]